MYIIIKLTIFQIKLERSIIIKNTLIIIINNLIWYELCEGVNT